MFVVVIGFFMNVNWINHFTIMNGVLLGPLNGWKQDWNQGWKTTNVIVAYQAVLKVLLSYWIIALNLFYTFYFDSQLNLVVYNSLIVLNVLSWFMVFVIILVSSCVIVNSIDYLTIMESYLLLGYISLFQFSMIFFTLSNDILITFLNWDIIGFISYLLINFWSSKTSSGFKAVVYNKCGDLCFLLIIAVSYSFLRVRGSGNYSILIDWLTFIFSFIGSGLFYGSWISFSLLLVVFTKSAQFPFSSWLLNAMSAPTPISALLHSSTMVIAGVYLGLILESIIVIQIDCFDLLLILVLCAPTYSLLWSLLRAFCLSDMKSIIACSTISQISYMFFAVLVGFSLVSIFHIVLHALFKSLLFLFGGSLIHVQSNFQSIYKIRFNNPLIKILFSLGFVVLNGSVSKESILHGCNWMLNSCFIFLIGLFGGLCTSLYSLKLYVHINRSSFAFAFDFVSTMNQARSVPLSASFVLPILTITATISDHWFDCCFNLNSCSLFYSISFFSFHLIGFDSILHSSLLCCISIVAFWIRFAGQGPAALGLLPGIYYVFDSSYSFIIPQFQYLFLMNSAVVFKAPIYTIEMFAGYSSSLSLYQVLYFSSFQLVILLFNLMFLFSC